MPTGTGTGAGGGAGAGGGGGAATDVYSSSASDIDLLDGLADETLAEETGDKGGAGGDEGAAAGAGDKGADQGAGDEGDQDGDQAAPEWLETAPEELKGLLAAGNVSAAAKEWLKKTFEEFSGLKGGLGGDPVVAAELTDLFPGGMEDIREAHVNSENFKREMEQFASGDAGQQTELLAGLLQSNADAFVSLVPAGIDLLKQTLRDDWTQLAMGMSREYLDTITDGKFGGFFDGLADMAAKYNGLAESNPEEAQKMAAKLGGAALQMADWWAGAKPKLGYDKAPGDKGAGAAAGSRNIAAARTGEPSDAETRIALREAALFEQQLGYRHDQAINPLITRELSSAVKARGISLPNAWQQKVLQAVARSITKNLQADRSFQAKLTREYHRGDARRPGQWDRSDRVAASLVGAAKARAEKLIPGMVKRALDNLSSLGPAKVSSAAAGAGDPAAGRRSGGRTSTSTGGALSDADLKNRELSDGELLARITGAGK